MKILLQLFNFKLKFSEMEIFRSFCSGGQPPTMCPATTLRDTPGATSVSDCTECPGGFYCPDPLESGMITFACTEVFKTKCKRILYHKCLKV